MMKITDEQIKEMIKNKNDKIKFISSKTIKKGNKVRRLVTMKCNCGNEFNQVLDKLKSNKYLMCNSCVKKMALKTRKKHYNKKYLPLIEENGFTLVNKKEDLYANKYVEVIQNETGYRGFIYPNRAYKHMLIFSLEHNKSNYIYNINKYAENIGVKSRAIDFCDDKEWSNQGIEFICECGREFKTTVMSFKNGKMFCNECSSRHSRNENKFERYLIEKEINYIRQFSINSLRDVNPLRFDFYLKDYNILVEIDGQHHFEPINFRNALTEEEMIRRFETYKKHDKMKEDYCKKYNIPLLRISYIDMNNGNYKNILLDFIQTVQD